MQPENERMRKDVRGIEQLIDHINDITYNEYEY